MTVVKDGETKPEDQNTPPAEDGNTPPEDGNTPAPDDKGGEGTPQDGGGEGKTPGKTLTPDEVNNIVESRLKRAREKWDEDQAEEKRKAKLSAEEKAREEKEEAERKANERMATADKRIVRAEAKGLAAEVGVKPDRIGAVIDLADLSGVEVSDDTNEPDGPTIRTALESVLEKYPEFKIPEFGTAPGNRKPAEGKAPTGLDAKIQAARDAGNFILAERLYAEKLAKEGKLGHPT